MGEHEEQQEELHSPISKFNLILFTSATRLLLDTSIQRMREYDYRLYRSS